MDIKKYLKNPKVWVFGIVILVIASVIFIIIMLKPTPNSPSGVCGEQKSYKCGDTIQCGPSCRDDDQTWDCDKKKCVCKDSTKKECVGNTQCCTNCDNDMCCSQENQVKSGDTSTCCSPGAIPNNEKTSCVVICGGKPCDPGKDCVSVSNLSPTDLANMKNQEGYVSTDANNVVYFCNSPPKCMFSTHSNLPGGDTTEGADYFYNTGDIFTGVGGESVCFPNSPDANSDCYSKNKDTCIGDCKWIENVFDEFVKNPSDYDIFKQHMENLNVKNNKSTLGYYCGDGNNSFGRFEVAEGQGTCDVTACINNITNDGTIRVNWDADSKLCSSLKGPNNARAGGVTSQIRCTGSKTPCPNCTKEGDYVDQCNDKPSFTWNFRPCKQNYEVLKYCTDDIGQYCGNCPWGDNLPASIIPGDGGISRGTPTNGNIACYSDGQIKVVPEDKYKKVTVTTHDGKSLNLCQKCTSTDTTCDTDATCDKILICGGPGSGYIPNSQNTSCNYICTMDHKDAAAKNNDDQSGEKFIYYRENNTVGSLPKNLCYRKKVYSSVGEAGESACDGWCNNIMDNDKINDFKEDSNFTFQSCSNENYGCASVWKDNITQVPSDRTDTLYLYEYPLSNKQSDGTDQDPVVSCWSAKKSPYVKTPRDYMGTTDPPDLDFFCNPDPPT